MHMCQIIDKYQGLNNKYECMYVFTKEAVCTMMMRTCVLKLFVQRYHAYIDNAIHKYD